jgi:O-antigen biosynthesis protein
VIRALLALFRRDRSADPGTARLGGLLLVVSRRRRPAGRGQAIVRKKIGGYRVSLHEHGAVPETSQAAAAPLDELLDKLIPRLDHDSREELFELVSSAARPYVDGSGGLDLAYGLRTLGDRLVGAALPEPPPSLNEPPMAVVDTIVAVDDRSFWVFGWARDLNGRPPEVTIVSPEGERASLLARAPRFDRDDVTESLASLGLPSQRNNGFASCLQLETPSRAGGGWRAELRLPDGVRYRLPTPAVTTDPAHGRATMMPAFTTDGPQLETLRREHAFPAVKRLQERAAHGVEIDSERVHGSPPRAPNVSIVIPLYRRIDLIEHQIAQFWRDPELAQAELIYVLDSPERAEELNRLAAPLHELYGLPFKVLTLNRNGGYAVANNLGASRARGRLLLLLNSDVLPARKGWLGQMAAFHDATPDIGALGPKLVYEDESIQHAGMYFKRDAATRLWENQHYYKGFARTLPAAAVSRPVPAVTGACMLLERALFESLGGLATVYVEGGYEDSDLCIRLVEAGRRNWYLADVELYHLEAQSFFIHARLANPCNAWIQTHLWNDQIEALMSAPPEPTSASLAVVS